MKRIQPIALAKISGFVAAVLLSTTGSTVLAVQVDFVPLNSLVNGPPYPTAALETDLVIDPSGTPVVIDRFSTSVLSLSPIGAIDWSVSDSYSFGVDREMKESGEKGGTEDINIGVGELQECTLSKSMDTASAHPAERTGERGRGVHSTRRRTRRRGHSGSGGGRR